jgi:hypothetical protein
MYSTMENFAVLGGRGKWLSCSYRSKEEEEEEEKTFRQIYRFRY